MMPSILGTAAMYTSFINAIVSLVSNPCNYIGLTVVQNLYDGEYIHPQAVSNVKDGIRNRGVPWIHTHSLGELTLILCTMMVNN